MNLKLIKNINYMVLAQAANYLLPLLLIPYLVRTLDLAGFGHFSLAQSVISVGLIVVQFGFNIYVTKDIAEKRRDGVGIETIVSNTLLIQVVLALGLIAVAGFAAWMVPDNEVLWLLFLYSFAWFGQALFPTWYYQGCQHFKALAGLNLLLRVTTFVLVIVFVTQPSQIWLVPVFYSVSYLIFGVMGVRTLVRERLIVKPELSELRPLLGGSRDVFYSSLISVVLMNLPIFFLGLTASKEEVGGFSAVYRILMAIKSLVNSSFLALLPHLVSIGKQLNHARLALQTGGVALMLVVPLVILREELLTVLYGAGTILQYGTVFTVLSLSVLPGVLATLFIYVFASFYGDFTGRRNAFFVVLLFNLVLYYPVTAIGQGLGASLLILSSDTLLLWLGMRIVKRRTAIHE